jgi:hypothetical protein
VESRCEPYVFFSSSQQFFFPVSTRELMLSVVQDDYSEPRPKSLAEAIEERAKDKEWRGCLDSKIFKLQSHNG